MANYMSMDHLKFVVHELLKSEELCKLERFQDYDKNSFDILLDSTKDYADKELFPTLAEMDKTPAHWKDGGVIVHPVVDKFMKDSGESGYISAPFDYEVGGMQLPHTIHVATSHIYNAANNHLSGYPGLTGGAAGLIVSYGNQELIEKFTPKMFSGDWGGTMCLTEPQAGSSLSDITTSATPQEDGTYTIKGHKIFISGGDTQFAENIVHLVLARIDGAPNGTKGISLFVVPKKKVTDNGLENNDVLCAGDFQKMGQKGYCTTHIVFGEEGTCEGYLVGEAHKGLKYMFQMMNGARIEVGNTATGIATAAYYASLQYAKERSQGRRIKNGGKKNVDEEPTLIINHPDVRRMLLLQKAVSEGSLALLLQCAMYHDLSQEGAEEDKERNHDLLEILTPIAKTYPSEMGRISVSNGLQILGGYGYCEEFKLEQYYRDIRISAIYEGTTGIQSLDLLGRKMVMKNGQAAKALTREIISTIQDAMIYDDLKPYANQLKKASKEMQEVLMHLLQYAMQGEHERYIADASIFMEYMSNVVLGWQWLKMATVAKQALVTGNTTFGENFYEDKILTMRYFFKYELPKVNYCKDVLMNQESITIPEETKISFA